MTEADSDSKSRRPAVVKGGQRRRLIRRAKSPGAEGSELPVGTAPAGGAPYEDLRSATPPEPSPSNKGLTLLPRQDNPFTFPYGQVAASPSPTAAGASVPATPSKKKFGFFSLKSTKDRDRSDSTDDMAITSPLPPLTPSKAKQLLGYDSDDVRGSGGGLDSHAEEIAGSRFTSRFKEEDVQPDTPKKSSFWSSNIKALKLLDMRPRQAKDAEDEETQPTQEPDQPAPHPLEGLTLNPRPLHGRRRRRKRGPKSLDRMTPITEMSHDALNSIYRNSESNTELDVISEYESPSPYPPRSASFLPRSQTESVLKSFGPFELDEDDISPSDRDDEENDYRLHSGSQINLTRAQGKQPVIPQWRSPLQRFESRLLDNVEEDLIHQKLNISRQQAAKMELDDEVAALRRSHRGSKRHFKASIQHATAPEEDSNQRSDAVDSDDDDLISISSSIDLDEEPVVCKAEVVSFTNATGHVKPITIVEGNYNVAPLKHHFENSMPVTPTHVRNNSFNRLTKDPKPKMPRSESQLLIQDWVSRYDKTKQRPVSERIDLDVLADQMTPPATFPKEGLVSPRSPQPATLPRVEPITPRSTQHANFPNEAPVSPRSPQPATSPNEVPVSPHPPRTSSRNPCVQYGHIFHVIKYKYFPDEDCTRPYLRPGMMQHIGVPVFCSRCHEDTTDGVLNCEKTICKYAVCMQCALFMQHEWKKGMDAGEPGRYQWRKYQKADGGIEVEARLVEMGSG
ncbi:hypothetical protein T440DRAFT_553652 [Plenodomus tracheiphilus IPT5]|uniref:Uncharacterized protein n=1 Tax=Plenodomus tracheiphilus IPT5 TaxID=1408161 RepID=A0A6A7BA29_9PLEO|nr:hypothetical protein T440DRAFT_553652 [Plenodomus tracheiphilus IPT5]